MRELERISLCPACDACPEVEIAREEDGTASVRLVEGGEGIRLTKDAWNTLVGCIRQGRLSEL
ncbi:MAG: hypothetical protein ACE147_21095 [Candidatus Methylomirabilales bacterium]